MSLRTALGWLAEVRDPNSPELVSGTPEEQRRKRLEWQRERNAQGIRERWEEIPSERLVSGRYWLEDVETGNLYRPFGGDPAFAPTVVAYFERDGWPVMLEPCDPPSRTEIERRRAARQQRHLEQEAAKKARRDELRKGSGR
jgi:hypothetical protein